MEIEEANVGLLLEHGPVKITRLEVIGNVKKRIENLQFYHHKSFHQKKLRLVFDLNEATEPVLEIIDGHSNWKASVVRDYKSYNCNRI